MTAQGCTGEAMNDATKTLSSLLDKAGVKVKFGLRQQGHFDTVTDMLADGKSWDEIGSAIGWHGPTVARHYGIAVRAEMERLRAERDHANASCARMLHIADAAMITVGNCRSFNGEPMPEGFEDPKHIVRKWEQTLAHTEAAERQSAAHLKRVQELEATAVALREGLEARDELTTRRLLAALKGEGDA